MPGTSATWDIVCRVVDNFGDVGIAWRLARQLVRHGCRVRLAVEGLASLATIEPRVDPSIASQSLDGIEIVDMSTISRGGVTPADVAVELLGCGLPTAYLDSMEADGGTTVWIDFEHLSAEPWVEDFHGRPSPHPTRRLVKHFFYPGFAPDTGGLLVDPIPDGAERPLPPSVAVPIRAARAAQARVLSLFAYPDTPVDTLFDALAGGTFGEWTVVVPGDSLEGPIREWRAGRADRRAPDEAIDTTGTLSIACVPFVAHDQYDAVLRACDVNVVRGEDSFVGAQVAGRPLVWQPYRQADDADRIKLAAFEALYGADIEPVARRAQRAFWDGWRTTAGCPPDVVAAWLEALPPLAGHATRWRRDVLARPLLLPRLIAFADERRVVGPRVSP